MKKNIVTSIIFISGLSIWEYWLFTNFREYWILTWLTMLFSLMSFIVMFFKREIYNFYEKKGVRG